MTHKHWQKKNLANIPSHMSKVKCITFIYSFIGFSRADDDEEIKIYTNHFDV